MKLDLDHEKQTSSQIISPFEGPLTQPMKSYYFISVSFQFQSHSARLHRSVAEVMRSNRDWDTENEVAKQEMEPDENK